MRLFVALMLLCRTEKGNSVSNVQVSFVFCGVSGSANDQIVLKIQKVQMKFGGNIPLRVAEDTGWLLPSAVCLIESRVLTVCRK